MYVFVPLVPGTPAGPVTDSPRGIEKFKTAFVAVPEFVTDAFAPEASDVTVPTDTAAAVPAGP